MIKIKWNECTEFAILVSFQRLTCVDLNVIPGLVCTFRHLSNSYELHITNEVAQSLICQISVSHTDAKIKY